MQGSAASKSIKAVILADIHMLGPFQGHWADRIYREWHMHRAFQTTMTLFRPDVVFILGASSSYRIIEKIICYVLIVIGDLFDEGQWVDDDQFAVYLARFKRLFRVPDGTRLYGALGNHDVGFHYK